MGSVRQSDARGRRAKTFLAARALVCRENDVEQRLEKHLRVPKILFARVHPAEAWRPGRTSPAPRRRVGGMEACRG